MPRVFPAAALLAAAACTPTFNWREITVEPAALHASFPCKPDKAERKMAFTRERELLVHAVGCEAGGASYAVLWADVGSPADLAGAMAQWKQASLATSHGRVETEAAFVPRGALALPQSQQVRAAGQRADGSALQSQSAYFARGSAVFQAVVFAPQLKGEMTEPFFAGLRFE
ncbi:hypothetical protein [Ramlibacter sp. PS4R-6]|uniref:hypothetical protein n=1 Tax=Ramlibacter sp. PS4R-6 TaxID=3133438 RepID=UPI0030B45035